MQAANRVAKNTAILYGRMAITMFISLYTTRLILGALGAEDFGIFSIVGGVIAMLGFLNASMASATSRFMSHAEGAGNLERLKSIFNVSVVIHILIAVVMGIVLVGAGYFFFNGILNIPDERIHAAKMVYYFMIVSTLITIISVPYDAVINAHENMLFVALLGILEAFLKLSIAIYVTHTRIDQLVSYGFLMALMTILLMLLQRFYCNRKYVEVTINIRKFFNKTVFKEMLLFGGWSFLGSAISMLSGYGQGIVLNIFFGTVVNAAQGIANQINGQLSAFSHMMLKALNPVIVKSEGAGARESMLSISFTGAKLSYFLLLFFALPMIIETPYILSVWLKAVPDYAIVFCQLILVISLIEQLFITLPTAISATGNIKGLKIGASVLGLLSIGISYLLFYLKFPPETLYYVFILNATARSFFVILYFAKKQCGLSIKHFFGDVINKSLMATILLSVVLLLPHYYLPTGLIRLVVIIILSWMVYPFALYWVGLNSAERNLTKKLLKQKVDQASLFLSPIKQNNF